MLNTLNCFASESTTFLYERLYYELRHEHRREQLREILLCVSKNHVDLVQILLRKVRAKTISHRDTRRLFYISALVYLHVFVSPLVDSICSNIYFLSFSVGESVGIFVLGL